MTVNDLRPLFHLRTFEACEALNICHSTFKGLCHRLCHWPFRKIQSLTSQFEDKKVQPDTSILRDDAVGAWHVEQEIPRLEREMNDLYKFPFLEPDQPTEKEYEKEAPKDNEGGGSSFAAGDLILSSCVVIQSFLRNFPGNGIILFIQFPPPAYQNWETTDPMDLSQAPVLKAESNPKSRSIDEFLNPGTDLVAVVFKVLLLMARTPKWKFILHVLCIKILLKLRTLHTFHS